MPRVKLDEQPEYEFGYNTTIQADDLNYAGHLGNDSLVRMVHEARIELFHELGFKELDLGEGKIGIIIGDLIVNFKSEGFLDDDIKVECHIGEITKKSLRIYHRIINIKNNKVLALAETGLVGFNYDSHEISEFPEEFFKIIGETE